jgi:hypothetical protein
MWEICASGVFEDKTGREVNPELEAICFFDAKPIVRDSRPSGRFVCSAGSGAPHIFNCSQKVKSLISP